MLGSLFIAEVGQDRYEEVDQVAGTAKAITYGVVVLTGPGADGACEVWATLLTGGRYKMVNW